MSDPTRVNVFGGPGIGKSVFAAKLYVALSERGHKIEHVNEWIKTWAWLNYKPESFDQLYVLAKQVRKEDIILRNKHSLVTDSPILMQLAYIKRDCLGLYLAAQEVFEAFRMHHQGSYNVFLERTVPYKYEGRYETRLEAEDMDKRIETEFLRYYAPGQMLRINPRDENQVKALIEYLSEKLP